MLNCTRVKVLKFCPELNNDCDFCCHWASTEVPWHGAGVLLKCDMWLVSALSVFTEDEVMCVLKQGAQ